MSIVDPRVAVRSLRRTPGFTLTAVAILALGIGLATAVFTVAHSLLLRPFPVQDQDRLVALWGETPDRGFVNYPLTLTDARAFARQARALERVAFHTYEGAWPVPFLDGDRVTRLQLALVSGNFFDVLGAQPVLGRALRVEDDLIGVPPVAVLSHAAWQHYFGGVSDAVGRKLFLHATGATYTIVGVMPAGLDYPRGAEIWASTVPARTRPGTDSTFAYVDVIARLRPTATPENAREEITAFFRHRVMTAPGDPVLRGVVNRLPRLIVGDVRPAVIAFTVAAGLLLLITCINVANLLFVRGLARRREIAVRSALGASRGHVIAQLVAENGVLSLLGGAVGVLVAAVAIGVFVRFAPAGLPRLDEIRMSATALSAATGVAGLAMLLFGLGPAIMTSRVQLARVLRSDVRQSPGRASRFAAEGLVAAQVVLAVLVLCGAGVVGRSFLNLERADLSFEPSHLLLAELTVRADQFDSHQKQMALLDRVIEEVQAVPGVRAVSPVVAVPFSGPGGWDGRPAAVGQPAEEASRNPMLNMDVVAPDYFTTFGIPVLRGRGFSAADREGAPAVVVLSASAARTYWPGADPIGKRLTMGLGSKDTAAVVGIVPETRYRDLRDARASIYFPLRQSIFPFAPTTLAIRTTGSPADVVPAVRAAINAAGPAFGLASAAPFGAFLEGPLAQPRLNALLLAVFAGAALTLAAIGLFGVMATMVRQRTRELGVRMALGATARELRGMVLERGLAIAAGGLVIGLLGAMTVNRLLAAMLYQVSPADGVTMAVVATVVLGVALASAALPARSSTRVDPVSALRAEG